MNSHALQTGIEELNKTSKKKFRDQLFFSSKSNEWETPEGFYNKLDCKYHFTLDPASTIENAKCDKFFTFQDNALEKDWSNNIVFCNPPYGRGIKYWIKKCYEEGLKENTIVVALIPSRSDTKYFHEFCMKAKDIYFVKGRLKFKNVFEDIDGSPAPFPSMVVVFDGVHDKPNFETMDNK